MRYIKYLFIVFVLVFSYSSKSYHTQKQIPPYYKLEIQGLNNRITNDLSDFHSASSIEKQVNRFRRQWALKGVSIAVVKNDQLVYAKGFGTADDQEHPVQPGNLFRVASVSKLLTAVAIMNLVEDHKLKLDDYVFGPDGIIKDSIFNRVKDRRLYKITVRHLLAHAGGWTQRYGDPAFNSVTVAEKVGDPLPATIRSYYKFIAVRRLSFYPGSRTSYSNMGYMFLGQVIATVSGRSYESYIQDNILIPNGIVDMHIGNSYQKNRLKNEVCYYPNEGSSLVPEINGSGKMVEKTNGGNAIELLGAAGGWICSAIEMARLVSYIDGTPLVKDILSPSSILTMTDNTYARGPLGWKTTLNNGNWIRTGSMSGTSAMIKRQADGLTWVFISNTSSWKGSLLANDINSLMFSVCSKVKNWPDQDLFNYYPIHSLPLARSK